jgi:hypothetical protein
MATDLPRTVRHFLEAEVFRSDYLIVDEHARSHTRLPYELKLERLHTLCVDRGYRDASMCEEVRRTLYTQADNSGRPVSLLLAESYLPDCVRKMSLRAQQSNESCEQWQALQASGRTARSTPYRHSWLDWAEDRYLLCLPADVHSLLIDNDGALLAA